MIHTVFAMLGCVSPNIIVELDAICNIVNTILDMQSWIPYVNIFSTSYCIYGAGVLGSENDYCIWNNYWDDYAIIIRNSLLVCKYNICS